MYEVNENGVVKDGGNYQRLDVFIVPSKAGLLGDMYPADNVSTGMIKTIMEFAKLNDFSFNPFTDPVVQVWLTRPDMENDCFATSSFQAEDSEKNPVRAMIPNYTHLPAKLFDGKTEGDTIEVKLSVTVSPQDSAYATYSKTSTMTALVTLAQKKWRYRNYGTFEEALKYVCK